MHCDEIRPALLDYVMEEVPAEARPAMARHLETCAACSEEVGKIRQTLGLMAQGASLEELPQRIRIVAEPAGRWAAFWRNPARLAFAGGAMACLAVAMLALARATVSYQDGDFQIAFGAAVVPIQSPAAAPTPMTAQESGAGGGTALIAAPVLTRQEVLALIHEAVAASEQRQTSGNVRIIRATLDEYRQTSGDELRASLEAVERRAESRLIEERRGWAESLRFFEAAQLNMWKQQVENQQVVSALVQRAGGDLFLRP